MDQTNPKRGMPSEVWRAGLVLLVMVGVQAGALGLQVARGYVPFHASPGRVAYSWDMFAAPVDRCDLRWEPPLPAAGGLPRLSAAGTALEWTPVFDRVETYQAAGLRGCGLADGPTKIRLTCLTHDGERVERELACP